MRKMALYIPLTVAVALVVVYLALPWPVAYRWEDPSSTSFMRYRESEARSRGETLEIRHTWVPLERIAEPMRRAVVLAEDGRFREHGGIDWLAVGEELEYGGDGDFSWTDPDDLKAVGGAALYYWRNRDRVRGRSTITQQLAKNLYFTPDRSLVRKVGEFVVARRLEWFLDKDRILELYLNTVELGPGLFGVEEAARHYFGTSAEDLGPFQAASLAATLPHPLTSNPETRPGRMAWRRDLIVARMSGRDRQRSPVPVAPEPVETPDVEVHVEADTAAPATEPGDTASPGPAPPDTVAPPPAPDRPDTAAPPPPDTLDRATPSVPVEASVPASPLASPGTEIVEPGPT
ncbi:MAG: transglycosylase domain-containing protein [Gemmatimonadetes bacterium]|nr:transglycosylase domain-containing protein [Gemmatimonadota bacterium]